MTIRKIIGSKSLGFFGALALGLTSAPALAQGEVDTYEIGKLSVIVGDFFSVEPLTDDEETRVPLARQVVAKMMPDGWYAGIVEDSILPMFAPLMEMASAAGMDVSELAGATGISYEGLEELSQEDRVAITTLVDPYYQERNAILMDIVMAEMTGMMVEMEPAVREGMSKAYARNFSDGELQDIAAFFATPTGEIYAAKSMLLAADPQIMSASMQAAPMMMERMPAIFEKIEEATIQLPVERSYDELSAQERTQLAGLLGVSQDELQEGMLSVEDPSREEASD